MTRGGFYENQSADLLSAAWGRYQGEIGTHDSRVGQVRIFISKRELRFKLKATLAVFKLVSSN